MPGPSGPEEESRVRLRMGTAWCVAPKWVMPRTDKDRCPVTDAHVAFGIRGFRRGLRLQNGRFRVSPLDDAPKNLHNTSCHLRAPGIRSQTGFRASSTSLRNARSSAENCAAQARFAAGSS